MVLPGTICAVDEAETFFAPFLAVCQFCKQRTKCIVLCSGQGNAMCRFCGQLNSLGKDSLSRARFPSDSPLPCTEADLSESGPCILVQRRGLAMVMERLE